MLRYEKQTSEQVAGISSVVNWNSGPPPLIFFEWKQTSVLSSTVQAVMLTGLREGTVEEPCGYGI